MRFIIFCLILFRMPEVSFTQTQTTVRYKDLLFDEVTIRKNILYNNDDSIKIKYRQLDLYTPARDSNLKRPLIIWLHGGGFKYGKKHAKGIEIWGNTLAQRGFVMAAMNYRLSKKHPLRNFKDLASACYDAIDDIRTAISFFKTHASEFGIDTHKIILGGNSAGGMAALQAVYSNRSDLQNVLDTNKVVANTGNYNPDGIAGIINFWGALFNDAWLSRANVPIVSVCGAKDRIVPPDTEGKVFFGSVAIHKKADALHIANALKVYEGYGHELQKIFNPFFRSNKTKQRWKEAINFSASFIYDTLLK